MTESHNAGGTTRRRVRPRVLQAAAVLVTAMAVIVTGAAGATAAPAKKADKPAVTAKATAPYTPKAGLLFNNPRGSHDSKYAIIKKLNAAIKATPKGGTIRFAQYLFDIDSPGDNLIDAYRRGVNVKILTDNGEKSHIMKKLKKVLNKDRTDGSYVDTCRHSCFSTRTSVMHAKFYTFSTSGDASRVSLISSANPYTGNTYKSWNDLQTIVNDETVYDSLAKYFDDMRLDIVRKNYYRTTTSGKNTLYFFPKADGKLPQLAALKAVKCTGVASGYGNKGRTQIRVAMWGWTRERTDIATQLRTLFGQGCDIKVYLNKPRVSPKVYAILLKRSAKYGKMKIYDTWYDKNHNGAAELYMHLKAVTINGNYNGDSSSKLVFTGSQNFSGTGSYYNAELAMRVFDGAQVDRYNERLDYVRAHYTKGRITSVPPPSYYGAKSVTEVDKGLAKALEDYDPDSGDVETDR
jgi:phosphatidylserine/phosphatidylglycerophosphate/cardiolipin synthase-like enzyme